jgi:hypothetical protein
MRKNHVDFDILPSKNFGVARLAFKKLHMGKRELLLLTVVGVLAGVVSGLTL